MIFILKSFFFFPDFALHATESNRETTWDVFIFFILSFGVLTLGVVIL